MAAGVVLAAVWVATAGPIGFVALAAPQIARRLARAPGTGILPAAAMGALVMVVSELLGQRLLSPFQVPVGLITSAVGGWSSTTSASPPAEASEPTSAE